MHEYEYKQKGEKTVTTTTTYTNLSNRAQFHFNCYGNDKINKPQHFIHDGTKLHRWRIDECYTLNKVY